MIIKSPLLLLFLTFATGTALSQDKASVQTGATKTYYIRYHKGLVSTKDSADYIRVISPIIDTAVDELYVVTDYYRNGKVMLAGKSLNNDTYLKRQGQFIGYFENGNRKSEAEYDKGKPIGNAQFYYPNGKLYYKSSWDAKQDQWFISDVLDSLGKVLVQNGNGKAVFYSEDFKKIVSSGPIVNGLWDGEWKASNDTAKWICLYVKGKGTSGKSFDQKGNVYKFERAEIEPKFDGGEAAFSDFLVEHVHYPKIAKRNNVQGKVFVSFVIERDGRVVDVRLIRGIGSGCDEEAMRAVKSSPNWTPGYQFGMPVRVQYNVPIGFALKGQ